MRIVLSIAIMLSAVGLLRAESNESPAILKNAEQGVQARLEQFNQTKRVELLVEARELAASLNPRGGKTNLSKLDEGSLRLQLKVLLALAAARDPHYDRNASTNAVYLNVAPPLSKGTEPLMAGMDPKAIKDADVRKAYEDAIAENGRRNEKLKREMAISRALDRVVIDIWVFVKRGFPDNSAGRESSMEIIGKTVSDKTILSRLKGDSMPGLTW